MLTSVAGNIMGHGLYPSFTVCLLFKVHFSYIICTAFSGTTVITRWNVNVVIVAYLSTIPEISCKNCGKNYPINFQ